MPRPDLHIPEREHKYAALIEDARMNAQTDWEEQFVADLVRKTKANPRLELTEAQLEKLDQIADESR